jgi:hypothetical protein
MSRLKDLKGRRKKVLRLSDLKGNKSTSRKTYLIVLIIEP